MNHLAYFGVFDLALTDYFPDWSVRPATARRSKDTAIRWRLTSGADMAAFLRHG